MKERAARKSKPGAYRRVVTEKVNGKSGVQSEGAMEGYEFGSVPGYEHTLIWVNSTRPNRS